MKYDLYLIREDDIKNYQPYVILSEYFKNKSNISLTKFSNLYILIDDVNYLQFIREYMFNCNVVFLWFGDFSFCEYRRHFNIKKKYKSRYNVNNSKLFKNIIVDEFLYKDYKNRKFIFY